MLGACVETAASLTGNRAAANPGCCIDAAAWTGVLSLTLTVAHGLQAMAESGSGLRAPGMNRTLQCNMQLLRHSVMGHPANAGAGTSRINGMQYALTI
jgi:hypothetical protein